MSFYKITKQSEWRLKNILNSSSQYFGKNLFYFLTTLRYHLIYSVLCNFIDIVCGCLYHSRSNFCSLTNYISPSIGKIVAVNKTSKLPLSFLVCTSIKFFWFAFFFFFVVSYLNFKCSGWTTRNPKGWFFLFQQFLQKIC